MFRVLAGYLIVVGLLATSVQGQDLAQMARRVDSLRDAAVAARETHVAYRRAHPPLSNWSDSIAAARGAVTVYFNARLATTTRAAVAQVDSQLAAFGVSLRPDRAFVFGIVPDTVRNAEGALVHRAGRVSVRYYPRRDTQNPNTTATDDNSRDVADAILSVVASGMAWRTGPGIAAWRAGTLPLIKRHGVPTDWSALRLEIVSSPSPLGRSCFLGDGRACRIFLGLDTVPDPPRMLLDSAGRRRVIELNRDRSLRASRVETQRCLDGHDDGCLAILQIIGVGTLATPFVKHSFVALALELGGERSVERLLLSQGPAREALAAAAQRSVDDLVKDWQGHLGDRSGTFRNLPVSIALSSVVWIVVFTLLAFGSSRWR